MSPQGDALQDLLDDVSEEVDFDEEPVPDGEFMSAGHAENADAPGASASASAPPAAANVQRSPAVVACSDANAAASSQPPDARSRKSQQQQQQQLEEKAATSGDAARAAKKQLLSWTAAMAAHVPPSVADSNGQVDRAGVKAAGNSNCADDTVRSLAPSGASGRAAADPSAAPTCPGAGKARNSVASYLRERLAATATAERRDPPAVPPKALKSAVVVPAARQRPAAAQPPESDDRHSTRRADAPGPRDMRSRSLRGPSTQVHKGSGPDLPHSARHDAVPVLLTPPVIRRRTQSGTLSPLPEAPAQNMDGRRARDSEPMPPPPRLPPPPALPPPPPPALQPDPFRKSWSPPGDATLPRAGGAVGRARLPESYAPAPRDALHLRGPSAAQMRDDQQEHYSRHRSWSPAASPLDGDFRGHHWREQRVAYGQGAHPDHPAARRFPLRPVPDALPGDGRPHHLGPAHEWLPPEGRAGYPPAPEPRGGQRRLPPWTDSPHPHGDPFRHRGGAAGGRGDDPLRLYGSRGPAGDVPGMALHHPPPDRGLAGEAAPRRSEVTRHRSTGAPQSPPRRHRDARRTGRSPPPAEATVPRKRAADPSRRSPAPGDADFKRKRAATGGGAVVSPDHSPGSRIAAGGGRVRSRAVRVPPPSASGAATPPEPAGRASGRSRGASSHAADDVLAALELARSPMIPVGKAVAAANGRSGREGRSGAPGTAQRLPGPPKTASSATSEGRKPSRARQAATPRGALEGGGGGRDRQATRQPVERDAPRSGLSHTLKEARAPSRSTGSGHYVPQSRWLLREPATAEDGRALWFFKDSQGQIRGPTSLDKLRSWLLGLERACARDPGSAVLAGELEEYVQQETWTASSPPQPLLRVLGAAGH